MQAQVRRRARDTEPEATEAASAPQRDAEALAATDDLLDEIDAVLADVVGELSEQQFVDEYRQKGGE